MIDDIQAPHAHKWLQILTEFDLDFITYSEFFAKKLPEFFRTVFSLLDAPEPKTATGELDLAKIFEYIDARNLKCVGGVAFSAIGPFEVSEVKKKLGVTD